MNAVLYVIMYLGIAGFLAGTVARAVMYARQPLHLRWELYPVPHEDPEKVGHGGSYFEDVDWWTRSARFNWFTEMRFMVAEMVFLKGLWEFNRPLWYRSFPFHFGLYLTMSALGFLAASAVASFAAPSIRESGLGAILTTGYRLFGAVGIVLALTGAVGLLLRRMRDPKLRNYTATGDIFNLGFFVVAFVLLILGQLTKGAGAPDTLAIARGLLRFDTMLPIPGVLACGLVVSSLLIAYIPLTHMSHYVAKYFTYHSIRWDDAPMARAASLGKKFAEYLAYKPNWAAPHIGANGARTWAEIASANPHHGGGKK
jgi:nitrate reductase gamma subunit